MHTLREITLEEVPIMTPLATAFYAEADLPGEVIPEVFEEKWKNWINLGIGFAVGAWNGDDFLGGIGGLLYPAVTDDVIEAAEMFFYILPKARGSRVGADLLDEFERVGTEKGAQRIAMICLTDETGEIMDKAYRKRGYRPVEVRYCKEV